MATSAETIVSPPETVPPDSATSTTLTTESPLAQVGQPDSAPQPGVEIAEENALVSVPSVPETYLDQIENLVFEGWIFTIGSRSH